MGITEYNLINDIEEMERLGITAVPMMKIDEEPLLNFSKAIEWINKQGE